MVISVSLKQHLFIDQDYIIGKCRKYIAKVRVKGLLSIPVCCVVQSDVQGLTTNIELYFRRFVKNETLFEELVATAASLESSRWALGGNAPVMAKRFHMEGCKVLLGAVTSQKLRQQIEDEIKGKQVVSVL